VQITNLKVEGLFGHFDHEISFEKSSRVTLIAGPNGYGKTHLLKIAKAMLTLDIATLFSMPLRSAELSFDDGTTLTCTPVETPDSRTLRFSNSRGRESQLSSFVVGEEAIDSEDGSNLPSWLSRIDEERWYDERTSRYLSTREVERRFNLRLGPARLTKSILEENSWIARYVQSPSPILIDTKRLDTLPRSTPETAASRAAWGRDTAAGRIGQYMEQVRQQITEARRGSLARQQQLDENFAQTLLAASRATIKPLALTQKYEELLAFNGQLSENGLAAKSFGVSPPVEMNPTERRILNVVLENWEERLAPLRPVHEKLTVLRRIVNEKFLHKSVSFDERGLMRVLGSDGHELQLAQLSSGEQHLLALFSLLLFSASPGALVLIDEPEISLHAAWQHAFVGDIEEVARLSGLRIVMATHSTSVINGRWDIVRELGVLE
jgi:ABC-type transport system involved in cytochrome c biogenesis ATPase subunit